MPEEQNNQAAGSGNQTPAPVVLGQRGEDGSGGTGASQEAESAIRRRLKRRTYRPSAKATILGLLAIIILVGANVGVVYFVLQKVGKTNEAKKPTQVISSPQELDGLGVSKGAFDRADINLTITPKTLFKNGLTVDKEFQLGGKLTAADASLSRLQAGESSLSGLNVSGASSMSELSLRQDFNVAGLSRFQGPVTIERVLTAAQLNVPGNLTVGGTLTTGSFAARNLTSISALTVGGKIITRGSNVRFSQGTSGVLGAQGTASASGTEAAGTVAVNTGTGPSGGIMIRVTFPTPFSSPPRVVTSPIGPDSGLANYYINRTSTGFELGIHNPVGSKVYVFDYIVMQ